MEKKKKIVKCHICGQNKRLENIWKCNHRKVKKASNHIIRCNKCDKKILRKNLNRHLQRWHTRKISIYLNMPRYLIEKEDSEWTIDCDSVETIYEMKTKIAQLFTVTNFVSLYTSRYNRYFPIKSLSRFGVEIEYMSHKSQFSSCTYDISLNIESSSQINKFQENQILSIILKNEKIDEYQVFNQIFNLSYPSILKLYYVMDEIIKHSSNIVYNINSNSSKKNKRTFLRKRPKYFHHENVYRINKKTFYIIWNYFKDIKKFHFKHLLQLHSLKKNEGRLSYKYIYLYINEVDRSFKQIIDCLSIYTVIDADKFIFPQPFLDSIFEEFKNIVFSDKYIYDDSIQTKKENELQNHLKKPFCPVSTFYEANKISTYVKTTCLKYILEQYQYKNDVLWKHNLGIWKFWKIEKLETIFANNKTKKSLDITNFLIYAASFTVSIPQFKPKVKRKTKALNKIESFLKRQEQIKKRNWKSMKQMDIVEYWDNKKKLKKLQEFHRNKQVNHTNAYNEIKHLFSYDETNQEKPMSNYVSNCFNPPSHALSKIETNREPIERSKLFQASLWSSFKMPISKCSTYGDFITSSRKKIYTVMAKKEQMRMNMRKELKEITKEANESWTFFVQKLVCISASYTIANIDKFEIFRECVKNELNNYISRSEPYHNFEQFIKVNMIKCPIQAAQHMDRSITDFKKSEHLKKLDSEIFENTELESEVVENIELDSQVLKHTKSFHYFKNSINVDEKLLIDRDLNNSFISII